MSEHTFGAPPSTELLQTIQKKYLGTAHLAGKLVVIKFGGAAMEDPNTQELIAAEIAALHQLGVKFVVTHGGGNEIGRWLEKLNLPSAFVSGIRVTSPDAMAVTEMVLAGRVNGELTSRISHAGAKAIGLSGRSARLTTAEARLGPNGEELGRVGRITNVNPAPLKLLVASGHVPVLACVTEDASGSPLNINADDFAAEIAGALRAEWCIFLTNVDGIKKDEAILPRVTADEGQALISAGIVTGGMIQKVECALAASRLGVRKVAIANAAVPLIISTVLAESLQCGTVVQSAS
jgi:acetylglutamate kinase